MSLNIACFGPISESLGSVAGANLLVVRALIAAGHSVRLYSFDSLDIPESLGRDPRFSFERVACPSVERMNRFLRWGRWSLVKEALLTTLSLPFRARAFRSAVSQHGVHFDVLLTLGYPAYFRLPEGKTISWYQGPLHSEARGILRARRYIVEFGGWQRYLTLALGYQVRSLTLRLCCVRSDAVICGSEWSKVEIVRGYLPPKRIEVVPYPIDLTLFPSIARSEQLFQEPTFLWLGRVVPRKRLDLMIGAFELYRKQFGRGRLIIVGGFSYLEGQSRIIEQSPAREFIEYRKHVPRLEVPALLATTTVLVQPSEDENFGSSVAEALATGMPVVIGPTNGTKDYVGACGFIFKEYTPHAVCDAMNEAAQPHHRSVEFRTAARSLATQHFEPRAVGERVVEIISK